MFESVNSCWCYKGNLAPHQVQGKWIFQLQVQGVDKGILEESKELFGFGHQEIKDKSNPYCIFCVAVHV